MSDDPERPFTWLVWDSSKVPFSDERAYATHPEALSYMQSHAGYIFEPLRFAVRETCDFDDRGPRRLVYHYYQAGADGRLALERSDELFRGSNPLVAALVALARRLGF